MLPLDTYVTELRVLIHFANVVGSSVQINPPKHVLNFTQVSGAAHIWYNVRVLTSVFVPTQVTVLAYEFCSRAEALLLKLVVQFEIMIIK